MAKAGKWLRNFLTGRKEKDKVKEEKKAGDQPSASLSESQSTPVPSPAPKEKKRWSFRRSVGAGKELHSAEPTASGSLQGASEAEADQKRHAMAVAAATAAAADAAVAAAQAAAVVIRLTTAARGRMSAIEEVAAIKIQSVFRSYLARKALRALQGLVKLQALIRGHLVRKQATATLRCMQALVTAQARARAQRIRMVEEANMNSQRQSIYRRSPSPQDPRFQQAYEMDRNAEENVKIVEMDFGGSRSSSRSRSSYSVTHSGRTDHRFSSYYGDAHIPLKGDHYKQVSPTPSALTDMSPRACSGHFEEFSFKTAQSSPYFSAASRPDSTKDQFAAYHQEDTYSISNDYDLYPNYMANTESSRAKARSQSVPKQRPDTPERQPSRRRPSIEGRNIPRGVRMQRSSSQVGSSINNYHYPWSIKLDKSNMSLKNSECGSTSTVLTNTNYCRSLVPYEVHGK